MTQEVFFSRYIVDYQNGRLGNGAFGTVYKAFDSVNNVWLALKISEVRFIDGKKFSLISEFELIKKISEHKNIANYLNAYQFNSQTGLHDFVLMQYYEEGNLKQLKESTALSLDQIDVLIKGIAEGIDCLHQNNIIHRDLKPSNILIARDIHGNYIPKISDFGLSKYFTLEDSQISSSLAGGTLEYASPEQLYGHDIKPNTDLWAFGVIAYELLTNKKFFDVPSGSLSVDAKRNLIFKKISERAKPYLKGNIPASYAEIIERCLDYDSSARIQNTSELLHLLGIRTDDTNILSSRVERAAYDEAMRSGEIPLLHSFIEKYPDSIFVKNISDKIDYLKSQREKQVGDTTVLISGKPNTTPYIDVNDGYPQSPDDIPSEKQLFNLAIKSNSRKDSKNYLEKYPKGLYTDNVKNHLNELHKRRRKKTAGWLAGFIALTMCIFIAYFYISKNKSRDEFSIYTQNGLFGYLNAAGDTLTKAEFTRAEPFLSGIAIAYKGDAKVKVNRDGSYSSDLSIVPPIEASILSEDLINKADLNTLFQYNKQFAADPLISLVHNRISELEAMEEENEYARVVNSTNIVDMESFIASYPKSKHINALKKRIQSNVNDLVNKSEKEFFEAAKSANSKTLLESYLQKYPNGIYKVEVNVLLNAIFVIESKEAWDEAKATNSIEHIMEYIQQYPGSVYIGPANNMVNRLNKEKQQQAEKNNWESAKKSNNINQINIYINNNPNSEYIQEARRTVQELQKQSQKSIAVKEEDVMVVDEQCKTIISLFDNSFRKIPGGNFTTSDKAVKNISSFTIGTYEVTQEQYNTVMNGKNNAYFKDDKELPIENISYSEIRIFLDKLNSLSCNSYVYRLPTLPEWEYAAAGGNESSKYAGSDEAGDVAIYGKKKIGTQRIGTKRANGYGLYDMSGNVAEICLDGNKIYRKGGSWYDNSNKLEIRSSVLIPAQSKDKMTGLRLVREKK